MNLTGRNVILKDDIGNESLMVRIPKFMLSDVIEGAPDKVHPAFIVNGKEKECIYISKYQNVIRNERAVSLPGEDPAVLISPEEAESYCRNKGRGWHLMTSAEWAAIALWCLKNGTLPRGNNDSGRDWSRHHEHGTVVSLNAPVPEGEEGPAMRVGCGTGPASWSHDWTDEGIFDLNGNVWEITGGLRVNNGILEIVPDNDAVLYTMEDAPWTQINADTLETGEAGKRALCIDEEMTFTAAEKRKPEGEIDIYAAFSDIRCNTEKAEPGNLLQQLCLIPLDNDGRHADAGCVFADEEVRYPIRGGYWVNGDMAGVLAYFFYMMTEDRYFDVGFRSCYVDLEG